MNGLMERLEQGSSAMKLFCELELSEQQGLSGGMSLDLGLPVGENASNVYSKGEVIGTTRDGYQFTREDLFKLIGKNTGVTPPVF
jgi:hypothetical protein